MEVRQVIGVELLKEYVLINSLWLAKIEASLDTAVEKDRIDVWVRLHDVFGELGNAVKLCDVELGRIRLVLAMLLNEFIKLLLPTTDDDDLGTALDKLCRQCLSNTGGSANNQDFIILERHVEMCDDLCSIFDQL